MSDQDQGMTAIRVHFADGLDETRYVPGVVFGVEGERIKLNISWRDEPVVFERDSCGVYVELPDGDCSEDARTSTNRKP